MTPQEIFSLVGRDLVRVEAEFYSHTRDASEVVSSIVATCIKVVANARPALLLLASRLVSGSQ
jgi:hypothetical protein